MRCIQIAFNHFNTVMMYLFTRFTLSLSRSLVLLLLLPFGMCDCVCVSACQCFTFCSVLGELSFLCTAQAHRFLFVFCSSLFQYSDFFRVHVIFFLLKERNEWWIRKMTSSKRNKTKKINWMKLNGLDGESQFFSFYCTFFSFRWWCLFCRWRVRLTKNDAGNFNHIAFYFIFFFRLQHTKYGDGILKVYHWISIDFYCLPFDKLHRISLHSLNTKCAFVRFDVPSVMNFASVSVREKILYIPDGFDGKSCEKNSIWECARKCEI